MASIHERAGESGLALNGVAARISIPHVDNVATCGYIGAMRTVGVRELKNRLSEYLRLVQQGEEILVTDRDLVVAELRLPSRHEPSTPYPALEAAVRQGRARPGAPNSSDLYPRLAPVMDRGEALALLDSEREDR